MKRFIVTVACLLVPAICFAKVELFNKSKRAAINPDEVNVSFYDKGQYKGCEEMGLVHSQSYWGAFSTKSGMIKRIKKQVAKLGGTDILLKDTGHNDYTGSNTGDGVVFYCSEKTAAITADSTATPSANAEDSADVSSDKSE